MTLDHNVATETPPPASIDFEPPAYSQPTLPPAADDAGAGPSAARWGTRLILGGMMAVGALTASAYAFLPHGAPAAAAATASIAPTHTTANLEKLRDAFPTAPAETTCREGSERIAVVLYSALDALKTGTPTTELEATLFSSAAQVQGSTMTVPGRRIAVIRTNDNREPGASATEAMPGRYAGTLVIFDAVTSKPLCQTQLKASSATDTRWENVSPRALRSGYVAAVRDAVAEGAERLKIELDL